MKRKKNFALLPGIISVILDGKKMKIEHGGIINKIEPTKNAMATLKQINDFERLM